MNLFVEYTQEEIETLLSLFKKDYKKIEIFKGMTNFEIDKLCVYIKKEKLPPKKLIENYDYIWVISGNLIEVSSTDIKKIKNKYGPKTLIGLNKLFQKNNNPLIVVNMSELLFFKVKEHTEFSSKFYKNLLKYTYKKLSVEN